MRGTLLSALVLSTLAIQPASAAEPVDWSGHWSGLAIDIGPHYRIERPMELTISTGPSGLTVVDEDRQRGGNAPAPLHIEGRHVWATYKGLWPTPVRIEGTLSSDGKDLSVTMSGDGMTGQEVHTAHLRKNGGVISRFHAPRVDASGRRVTDYTYRLPSARSDGISVSSPEAAGMHRAPLEALVRAILTETGSRLDHQTESILVLRHGKLVLEEYFWGQNGDNPHMISSATKSVTSIVAGLVYDKGLLALDRPITSYFPERTNDLWLKDRYPITLRNVLSMSSGTNFDVASPAPSPFNSENLLITHDVVDFALNVPSAHPAGSTFNYDNSLPSLMAPLLAKVSRTSYANLADAGLFKPLGISNYHWTNLPEGMPLSAGGMYLRSRDMAKIGQMMLDKGTWHGKRIVSSAWVEESTRKQTATGQYPYGFYWHLNNAEKRRVENWDGYMAIGQGAQIIGVFPSQDIVIVMTSADWATGRPRSSSDRPYDLMSRYIVPSLSPVGSDRAQ